METWKFGMEDLLHCKCLNAPLEDDKAKPNDMTCDVWRRLDRKDIWFIQQL